MFLFDALSSFLKRTLRSFFASSVFFSSTEDKNFFVDFLRFVLISRLCIFFLRVFRNSFIGDLLCGTALTPYFLKRSVFNDPDILGF